MQNPLRSASLFVALACASALAFAVAAIACGQSVPSRPDASAPPPLEAPALVAPSVPFASRPNPQGGPGAVVSTATGDQSVLLCADASANLYGGIPGTGASGCFAAVSGFDAATILPINLSGGSGEVTNALPIAFGGTGCDAAPTTGQVVIAISTTTEAPTTVTGDCTFSAVTPGLCGVTKVNGQPIAATAASTGNTLEWNGSTYTPAAVNLAGGANYVTGTLPHGTGGTDVTSPGAAGDYLRSNGTNWAASTIQSSDLAGVAWAAGGDMAGTYPNPTVASIQGTGGTNSYQSNGDLLIDAGEVCMNSSGNTLSCNADSPKLFTTDGGINVLDYHGTGAGFVRVARITIEAHNNSCLGVADYQYCTLKVAVSSQTDGGGATMNPSSPVCAEGAPVFGGAGSTYGTPTLTLDAAAPATVYLNVQGTADAGCVDGGITWGAEWSSVITE